MASDSPWGSFRSKDMLKIISGDRTLEYVMFVAVTEPIGSPLAVRRKIYRSHHREAGRNMGKKEIEHLDTRSLGLSCEDQV